MPETSTRPHGPATGAMTVPRGPVLVATDGTDVSSSAIEMAKLMADVAHAEAQLLSIVEPEPLLYPPMEIPVRSPEHDAEVADRRWHELRRQAHAVLGESAAWPAEVHVGQPAEMIGRFARERGARLIITGLRHRSRLDRLLRSETPLAIVRQSRTPVLAVPEGPIRMPRVVLIGADATEACAAAAAQAQPLLAEAETVYVVHVTHLPHVPTGVETDGYHELHRLMIESVMASVSDAIALPPGACLVTRVLAGHPAEELLDFAERHAVELIVLGRKQRFLLDRLAHGGRGTVERVFRGAACSVLIVPEPTRVPRREEPGSPAAELIADRASWRSRLADFTRRNEGRLVSLQVETFDLGAQSQVHGYILRGVDYSESVADVHLMLGSAKGGMPHITHVVHQPRRIEIHRGQDGADAELRLVHDDGYTRLTFPR